MAALGHRDWPDRLWIVRHGQSAGNVARDAAELAGASMIDITTRDADTPLSGVGMQQARALGEWFASQPEDERPNVLMCSPFVRAQQTCAAVAEVVGLDHRETLVDERLREKEFGILDRYTRHGIQQKFPELADQRALVGKFYFRPPGGESWCDVILRLRSMVEVLRRDHVGDRVLIVGHQVTVNCFRYLLECMDETRILAIDREADVPNCSITEYALGSEGDRPAFALRRTNFVVPTIRAEAAVTSAPDKPAGPK